MHWSAALLFVVYATATTEINLSQDELYSFVSEKFKHGGKYAISTATANLPDRFATVYTYNHNDCSGPSGMEIFGNVCTNGDFTFTEDDGTTKQFSSQRLVISFSDPTAPVVFTWEVFDEPDCVGVLTAVGVFGGNRCFLHVQS